MPKPLDAALAARMRTISAPPGQTETRGCPSSAPVFKRTRGCSQAIFALWKSPTVARRQTIRNTSPDQPLRYADACSMRTQERDIDATCNRRYNCYNTLRQECRTLTPLVAWSPKPAAFRHSEPPRPRIPISTYQRCRILVAVRIVRVCSGWFRVRTPQKRGQRG
jgi:hypothetical protein